MCGGDAREFGIDVRLFWSGTRKWSVVLSTANVYLQAPRYIVVCMSCVHV